MSKKTKEDFFKIVKRFKDGKLPPERVSVNIRKVATGMTVEEIEKYLKIENTGVFSNTELNYINSVIKNTVDPNPNVESNPNSVEEVSQDEDSLVALLNKLRKCNNYWKLFKLLSEYTIDEPNQVKREKAIYLLKYFTYKYSQNPVIYFEKDYDNCIKRFPECRLE